MFDELPTYGGSLRLYVQRRGTASAAVIEAMAEEEEAGLLRPDYYCDFAQRVRAVQRDLKALLASLKEDGKRIAGYGVAAKAAVILNSTGIDHRLLDYMVNMNPHKQGKYVPGVRLPIDDPGRLLEAPAPDYVLLFAWNLKDEVMEQQREYMRRGGRFIVPIPIPQVVSVRTRSVPSIV